MNVVLLFPGQGSQKPGMGRDVADAFSASRAAFAAVDAALGVPLSTLCFEGPADALTLTHNAQPALLAHAAAVLAEIQGRVAPLVRAAAGHSLGEFSAYYAAGTFTLADAVRLVRRRGELMYQSGVERPGAMAAILGELSIPIEDLCERASQEAGLVVPANFNCPGQLVISGEILGVERAMALCKEAGAKRAMRLNVSGAFHSPLMAGASAGLTEALASIPIADPAFDVYANTTGEPVASATAARTALLEQLVSPVQWTREIVALTSRFADAIFLELGPGTVLAGLVKKIAPGARVYPCGTVADIHRVMEVVAQ